MFDSKSFKAQFPIFQQLQPTQTPLLYWDNAATTQIPQCVIDSISNYIITSNANIHRGIYKLSLKPDEMYENTRRLIANYINAQSPNEIIYTSGATEGINLIAFGLNLKSDDEILILASEHHANILPWLESGAKCLSINITNDGIIDIDDMISKISDKTKIITLAHVSNVLGIENPIKQIANIAHRHGIHILVDGAQSLSHSKIDVQDLNCDYFVTSAHKAFGPTGIGFVYCKEKLLHNLRPLKFGGGTVKKVTFDNVIYKLSPEKFEPGTPNMIGIAGMNASIKFLSQLNFDDVKLHLKQLSMATKNIIKQFPNFHVLCPNTANNGIISIVHENIHPHDIASIFDQHGIAVRAGTHCAQPLIQTLKLNGTVRLSFSLYNSLEELETLERALYAVEKFML